MTIPAIELDEVVEAARPHLASLKGARIFVTGGTGFWGTWLLESLRRANLGVHATVLSRDPGKVRGFEALRGDVKSFDFPSGEFTHVLHLATASCRPEPEAETIATIVDGTRRVLDFARERKVARVLYASSGAVYGRQPPDVERIAEDFAGAPDPLDARSAYGNAKRLGEQLCAVSGVPCVVARGFAFAGAGLPLDAHFAIGNFVGDAIAKRPITVRGDGTPWRSYLYASDLAAWLWTLLASGRPGRAYNVGSEEAVTVGDLARRIAESAKLESKILGTAEPGRPAERYVPSTKRARAELGVEQRVGLDEAIRRTIAAARST